MNWEAIGALSELFGAIAVVASLVYLSRQLKMTREVEQVSNTLARAAAYQDMGQGLAEVWLQVGLDPEKADVNWRSMMETPIEMTENEYRQAWAQWVAALRLLEITWRQVQLGLLDPAAFDYFGNNAPMFAADGPAAANLREMWPDLRMALSPDFAAFMTEAWELEAP